LIEIRGTILKSAGSNSFADFTRSYTRSPHSRLMYGHRVFESCKFTAFTADACQCNDSAMIENRQITTMIAGITTKRLSGNRNDANRIKTVMQTVMPNVWDVGHND
jgi:hypothetical protein